MLRASQPETAPSRMLFCSSSSREMLACWTLPNPVQVGQAPSGLLKEKCAMPIAGSGAPQWGQGKVASGAGAASLAPASPSHSASAGSKEGGTSPPQVGQG